MWTRREHRKTGVETRKKPKIPRTTGCVTSSNQWSHQTGFTQKGSFLQKATKGTKVKAFWKTGFFLVPSRLPGEGCSMIGPGQYQPMNTIHQLDLVEVDQQPHWNIEQFHVAQ